MTMNIAVIGCTNKGTAAISQMSKLYPEARITVYERNDNHSFLTAPHDGGVVKHMRHDVFAVDTEAKRIQVRNLVTGSEFTDSYDKLVVTTDSAPISQMDGMETDHILHFTNNNMQPSNTKAKHANTVDDNDAGYIGIEFHDVFKQLGKQVTLIDKTIWNAFNINI